MKHYLLIKNGACIADYVRRTTAENAFRRAMYYVGAGDVVFLYDCLAGRNICSTL